MAKKKRAETRRCKQRGESSSAAPTPSASASGSPTAGASSPPASPNPPPPAAPPANPPPSTAGGGKVCLAWNNGNQDKIGNFVTPKVGLTYTWNVDKPALADQLGLQFAPILHNGDYGTIQAFNAKVTAGYGSAILGFNEPDLGSQANMSPGYAAQVWKDVIQPHAGSHKLITPAVTSAPAGIEWLAQFMAQCTGCTFGGVAVHWYGLRAEEFNTYIKTFHDRFNLPIWVTEFACQSFTGEPDPSLDQVKAFMGSVTAYMDSVDWVEHYCPFGLFPQVPGGVSASNALMTPDFQPNDLWRQVVA